MSINLTYSLFVHIFKLNILNEEIKKETNVRAEPKLAIFPSKIIMYRKGNPIRILNNVTGIALTIIFFPEKINMNFGIESNDICSYKPQNTTHDINEKTPIKVHHKF